MVIKTKNTNKRKQLKKYSIYFLFASLLIIIFINIIGQYYFFRLDLTSEKRHSVAPTTAKMLKGLDDIVYFKVYLDGNLSADFKYLRNRIKEILDEFRVYNKNIQYEFINPHKNDDKNVIKLLVEKGLTPHDDFSYKDGVANKQIIFPGALISYKGKEMAVNFYAMNSYSIGNMAMAEEARKQYVNISIEKLEHNLSLSIKKITSKKKNRIAFLEGQGELSLYQTYDIMKELSHYEIRRIKLFDPEDKNFQDFIKEDPNSPFLTSDTNKAIPEQTNNDLNIEYIKQQSKWLNKFDALVIAKPTIAFTEGEKFLIDQFIMNGGKVAWFIDPVFASMDSLSNTNVTVGISQKLNLDDQLMKYGVYLKNNLVQDLNAINIVIMDNREQRKFPWIFFPLLIPKSEHPIVNNLAGIKTEFASSIKILDNEHIKATPLLSTSKYNRSLNPPVIIDLKIVGEKQNEKLFNDSIQHIAVLLEGTFESLYKNRILPDNELNEALKNDFKERSKPSKMIVVSDGDIIKNDIRIDKLSPYPIPLILGFDKWTGILYDNRDFVLNAIDYLFDEDNLIETRTKKFRIRELDNRKVNRDKVKLQFYNTMLPPFIILIVAFIVMYLRKKIYSK